MKPAAVCLLLSKFGMFTFVVSHIIHFILFFRKWRGRVGQTRFLDFGEVKMTGEQN